MRRTREPEGRLAILKRSRYALGSLGRQLRDAPSDRRRSSFALPVKAVPHSFLPGSTRPTWAYPTHYTSALAFSVIPMLRLLGLPYGWAGHDPRGPGRQLFQVLHSIPDTLGPLYTPAAL